MMISCVIIGQAIGIADRDRHLLRSYTATRTLPTDPKPSNTPTERSLSDGQTVSMIMGKIGKLETENSGDLEKNTAAPAENVLVGCCSCIVVWMSQSDIISLCSRGTSLSVNPNGSDLFSTYSSIGTFGADKIRDGKLTMEHAALLRDKEATWQFTIMTRRKGGEWLPADNVYPKLKTRIKGSEVIVDMEDVRFDNDVEFAVFGKPGAHAKKRAQILVFGSTPTVGEEWQTHVVIVDDTYAAVQNARDEQNKKKRYLLRPPTFFVRKADPEENITVCVQNLKSAWLTLDDAVKVVNQSDEAVFTFGHVNMNKTGFYCEFELAQGENKLVIDLYEKFAQKKPQFVDSVGPGTLPDKETPGLGSGDIPTCRHVQTSDQPLTWINEQILICAE